jgi:hypothetical protein
VNGADPQVADRRWAVVAVAGVAVAAVSILLAAAAGGPYLSLERLSPWLVTYAIGLFAALFAAPFLIRERLGGMLEADARWERALLLWGALALALLGVGLVCGLAGDFAADSLAGSFGLVSAVAAGLVLATLIVWLISG